jgi:hypothetical protein
MSNVIINKIKFIDQNGDIQQTTSDLYIENSIGYKVRTYYNSGNYPRDIINKIPRKMKEQKSFDIEYYTQVPKKDLPSYLHNEKQLTAYLYAIHHNTEHEVNTFSHYLKKWFYFPTINCYGYIIENLEPTELMNKKQDYYNLISELQKDKFNFDLLNNINELAKEIKELEGLQ